MAKIYNPVTKNSYELKTLPKTKNKINSLWNNKLLDKVFKKYNNSVNMTFIELKIWSKNPLSKKASLNRKPIERNLKLLSKPKSKWNMQDIKEANKTISYLARAKKIKSKNFIKGTNLTKNYIALRNWGFDRFKK